MNYQSCPACDGDPTYLGPFGRLQHLRCRACAWVYSAPAPEPEAEDFEDTDPQVVETTP
jgi:hypothetical protein